ncbi:MAG: N-acetylmuramoyl-L-alanine amidase [Clostridia bacterium]|nr:N-acetylmuramoyl-L-alanine amidase [Clostridia bacterium]
MKTIKILGGAAVVILFIVFLSVSGGSEGTRGAAVADSETTAGARTEYSPPVEPADDRSGKKPSLTVIIDPGHGFGDPGSQPAFLKVPEKELTMKTARYLKEELEKRGADVVLTHDGTSYPDENEIMRLADSLGIEYEPEKIKAGNNVFSAYERMIYEQILEKRYDNCFFISLHTNSVEDAPEKKGSVIDWCADNPEAAGMWDLANDLTDRLHTDLGVKLTISEDSYDMAFIVTKRVEMPAVLLELGYGSNREDAEKLQSEAFLLDYAKVLAEVIVGTFAK